MELGSYEFELWLDRADLLIELGEYRALIINIEHGLEFYPNHPELLLRLGVINLKLGKETEGLYHLQTALKDNPVLIKTIVDEFADFINARQMTYLLD